MGALISETVRYNQMRTGEVIKGIDGDGDNAKGETMKSATPLNT